MALPRPRLDPDHRPSELRRAQHDLGRPYLDQPELVAQPADACLTAASFWRTHHLNDLADASNTDAITLAINGPRMVAAGERRQAFDRALAALR